MKGTNLMNSKTILLQCAFCALPAIPSDATDPPACGAHTDLIILTEWMIDKGEPITTEAVAAHVAKARASSDGWTIQWEEVEELLPAVMERVI
jgi:hypothetical protein